jgi:predicted DNA-binding protein
MTMQRVQMLLEPRQRRKLAELAKAQGKSVAEVTRQAIDAGLEQISQQDAHDQMRAALEAAVRLRESMRQRNGGPLNIDIVHDVQQMREVRDEELIRRGGL